MRNPQFQTSTQIVEEQGKTFVVKKALTEAALSHIQSFIDKENDMKKNYKTLEPVTVEVEKNKAIFPMMQGKSVDALLQEMVNEPEQLQGKVAELLEIIFDFRGDVIEPFEMTEEFKTVFGSAATAMKISGDSVKGANIDAIFDNILMVEDRFICIDYEWIFDFPIPIEYLKFRTLYCFFEKYRKYLEPVWSEAEFLQLLGVSHYVLWSEMEKGFQEYVFGKKGESNYLTRYVMPEETIDDLRCQREAGQKEIKRLNDELHKVGTWAQGLDADIEQLRKNENSIRFLVKRIIICCLKAVYKIMSKTIDLLFPRETKRRKYIDSLYLFLLKPTQMIKQLLGQEEKITLKVPAIKDFQTEYKVGGRITFDYIENPKVSIIIPVYNQMNYTYKCLQSIRKYTPNISYEIIIADDVSSDETARMTEYVDNVIISRNETNLGFLRNCNNAARKARGEYLFFLNNDTQVTEGWLEPLITLIESDESIGMVGSKLVYPDGRLQEAGGIIWNDASGWNYGRLDNPSKPEYNYVREVDYISGAAIMISKSLWNKIGGFDERYVPAYCEDSDLAFQVRQQGYKVLYQPKSVVIHFEGISNGTDTSTGIKAYQVENGKKFYEKWKNELEKQYPNAYKPFVARERAYGKKTVVFVDHYVPMYDKDAGSKTTFQYIKMFLKKGYIVKFVGDNFYPHEPYTEVLQQMGVEVLYGPYYSKHIFDWFRENQEDIDFVYLNRPHITEKYIDFLKENTNIKLIYYGHDLHFLRMSREYELTKDEELKKDIDVWKKKEFDIMKKAAMSYYPSYIEEEAIHEIDPSIKVKAITAYVFEKFREDIRYDFTDKKGILFVGGFGHGPNVDAVLWFAKEVYPLIRAKADIPFYIVGSNATDEVKALEGNGITVKGFVSEEELCELYLNSKLVVVPLRYGAGVKGKVVEAIYYGTPIITTSVGAEGIPEADSVMRIENNPAEFAELVVTMYCDNDMLKEMVHATQDYIKKYFSIEAAWKVIEEDFQ